jgi:hypothetical protein
MRTHSYYEKAFEQSTTATCLYLSTGSGWSSSSSWMTINYSSSSYTSWLLVLIPVMKNPLASTCWLLFCYGLWLLDISFSKDGERSCPSSFTEF